MIGDVEGARAGERVCSACFLTRFTPLRRTLPSSYLPDKRVSILSFASKNEKVQLKKKVSFNLCQQSK